MQPMQFFLAMEVPRTTYQEHGTTFTKKKGKTVPVFFDTPALAEARSAYLSRLIRQRPEKPYEGPMFLKVIFCFPSRPVKGKKHGDYKFTKPDTDNMIKLFKDCMTEAGFWKDDAQVASEWIEKRYSDKQGVFVYLQELDRSVRVDKEEKDAERIHRDQTVHADGGRMVQESFL